MSAPQTQKPSFAEWKVQLDAIALEEGLTPKENPPPGEMETWIKALANAKLVSQADRMHDLLVRAADAIEVLDGTSIENEKLVDDYRAWRTSTNL